MTTAYLLMKLQHDGSNGVPKIVDVRIFSEPQPSMLGFQYSYAELTRMDGATLEAAMNALLDTARRWPWLQWTLAMPGMQGR
jgi:hypothetical protein